MGHAQYDSLPSYEQHALLDRHGEMVNQLWSMANCGGERSPAYAELLQKIRDFEEEHDMPHYFRESY